MYKQLVRTRLASLLTLSILCIAATSSTVFAQTQRITPPSAGILISQDEYISSITNRLVTNMNNISEYTIRQATIQFCNAVVTENSQLRYGNNRAKYFLYDPRQSYFLYVLCNDITDTKYPFVFDSLAEGKYRKIKTRAQHQLRCDPKSTLNQCDFSKHLPKLFKSIINEYTRIVQAGIVGLKSPTSLPDDDKADGRLGMQINAFFSGYFLSDEACTQKNTCRRPTTFKRLENYMKSAEKLLQKLEIVNYQTIYEDAVKNKTKECMQQSIESGSYNIVMCGLYGDDATPLYSFTNLLYNERMYYRLFMNYYATLLQNNPRFSNDRLNSDLAASERQQDKRVRMVNNEIIR